MYVRILKKRDNDRFKKGIENELILDDLKDFVFEEFYENVENKKEYGEIDKISNFKKMDFCKKICSLENNTLEKVFLNLKFEIEELNKIFTNN